MNHQKIYMKAWLDFHGRIQTVDSDFWYVDFANRILPLVNSSSLYSESLESGQQEVALMLTLYLEDCVADGGNWNEFIHWHHKNYGKYLPFYSIGKDYLCDEINQEDIAFLLWGINSPVGDNFDGVENPLDIELLSFSQLIYDQMDEAFEEAPISEHLATDWMMETELMQKKRTPIHLADMKDVLPTNVERFLAASDGEPLMYFDSYSSLCRFFIDSLGWENKEDELLPDLKDFDNFVLFANQKGLLVGPDVAEYFADPRNPMFSQQLAEDEAYELFCEQGLCPFDLLKYAMESGKLSYAQFPFENGQKLLHQNWDFVSRWFLGEYYEGE